MRPHGFYRAIRNRTVDVDQVSQSVGWSVSQSVSKSVSRSVSQSVSQSVSESTHSQGSYDLLASLVVEPN